MAVHENVAKVGELLLRRDQEVKKGERVDIK